jgi:hypothetical protein
MRLENCHNESRIYGRKEVIVAVVTTTTTTTNSTEQSLP